MPSRRQFFYGGSLTAFAATTGCMLGTGRPELDTSVDGVVVSSAGAPVARARVTLFTPDETFFRETRTDEAGRYSFTEAPPITYRLGACALGREYREIAVTAGAGVVTRNFTLGPDLHPGSWQVIGTTAPEVFGGTNTGSLMADGQIFYCHDTQDPVVFNPQTSASTFPPGSSSTQGCHMPTHLPDGRLLIVGGGDVDAAGNFNGNSFKTVRAYDPLTATWENWPDLLERRWYPGLARLQDGRLLLFGGGQQPDKIRTASCEILDPRTRQSTVTGAMLRAGGFGPAILLYTGEVLVTWDPSQLYNPTTGRWRAAGQFVQPLRATGARAQPPVGDHPDHTAICLPDGRIVAIGIRRTALGRALST